uniref:Uncharacterized protein n=1 Tax=Anguilla anguilla TaxID=7936 RepID=A0A0E9WPA5_ANGAN
MMLLEVHITGFPYRVFTTMGKRHYSQKPKLLPHTQFIAILSQKLKFYCFWVKCTSQAC